MRVDVDRALSNASRSCHQPSARRLTNRSGVEPGSLRRMGHAQALLAKAIEDAGADADHVDVPQAAGCSRSSRAMCPAVVIVSALLASWTTGSDRRG